MFFEYNVTYPPNVSRETEQVDILRLTRGIVKKVEVVFPRGCAGLVNVRLFREFIQVIPSNYPSWLDADGETITINTNIDLTVNPYQLEARGYNLDDTYEHTIRYRFEIEIQEEGFEMTSPAEESKQLISELGLT